MTALNLLRLYALTYNNDFLRNTQEIFDTSSHLAEIDPENMAQMLIALDAYYYGVEIAVITAIGRAMPAPLVEPFYRKFLPGRVLALGEDGQPTVLELLKGKKLADANFTAYICEKGSCQKPTGDLKEIQKQLSDLKRTNPLTITM